MQMDFQTLFLFMHSRVYTYTPLEPGSPYCPVALGFLHLARRGAFLKSPIEAWTSKTRRCVRVAAILLSVYIHPNSKGEIINVYLSAVVWEKRT